MMDRKQLGDIQRRMEEEHRRDKEALERLMRFIPDGDSNPKSVHQVFSTRDSGGKQSDVEPLSEMDQLCLGVMRDHSERDWTIRALLQEMESNGARLPATRPEGMLNRTMRRLVAHGLVTVVLEPQGRRAGIYKFRKDPPGEQKMAS